MLHFYWWEIDDAKFVWLENTKRLKYFIIMDQNCVFSFTDERHIINKFIDYKDRGLLVVMLVESKIFGLHLQFNEYSQIKAFVKDLKGLSKIRAIFILIIFIDFAFQNLSIFC